MQKINYELEMERVLASLAPNQVPTLLLHSCCAPCSSAVLERLSDFFEITVDYYNPNIAPAAEYHHRAAEQKRLLHELSPRHPLHFIEGVYEPEVFFALAAGLEDCPEGGERCRRCY
ncbi:MAG: epoxyqueuosine reductase QueH, partial [Pygmaiobacter sp.]